MDDFDDHKGNSSPSSLKELLSCCFRKNRNHHPHHRMSLSVDVVDTDTPRSLTRSSSARYKSSSSSGSHHETPEIKDKCKTFISRFNNRHRRRHSASADFRYDPLSYALNFDEGYDEGHLADEFPMRNFSSRLPASPPKPSSSSGSPSSREITAYS